jgi:hypothetical protein
MAIFISTFIFIYLVDAFLVGVSFFALRERFQWQTSSRVNLLILFLAFAFIQYYLLPMALALDVTFTIRNPEVVRWFNLRPDEPLAGLFGIGVYEIIIMVIQALLAALLGEKLFPRKPAVAVEPDN